jgi:hypothetical protein
MGGSFVFERGADLLVAIGVVGVDQHRSAVAQLDAYWTIGSESTWPPGEMMFSTLGRT